MAASKAFPIRLTEQEHELLKQVAAHHDRDRSDLLRWLLRQEAKRIGIGEGASAAPQAPADATDDDGFTWKDD